LILGRPGTINIKVKVNQVQSGSTVKRLISNIDQRATGWTMMNKPPKDLTDRKIEELSYKLTELESLNLDLMGMIENSFDGMCVTDSETRMLLLNPAFYAVMGFENTPCLGRTTRELVEEGLVDNSASITVVKSGKPHTVMLRTAAGRRVLSTGVPVFDENGKIHRVYCNVRDITELSNLKEKYEESERLASKYLAQLHEVKRAYPVNHHFIARSHRMKQLLETTWRIARVDATVLLLGESGVGKDVMAAIIHEASPRKDSGAFVKINCGAIPGELLESELFGYEAGAFTGAVKEGKAGYFEIAHKGTLFLDEIADLPLKLQVKLLSVIQDQQVRRLGGTRSKMIDVRIIAATNQDLEKMVKLGKFREDLFYRLNVVQISIPPLRERRDEIPFLLIHFLNHFTKKYSLKSRFSKELIDSLCAYRWPGNVRELANLVEHLVVMNGEEELRPEHLPKKYVPNGENDPLDCASLSSMQEMMQMFERKVIETALSQCRTLEEAAHKLGISMSTLTRKKRSLKENLIKPNDPDFGQFT
jgi:PAS domain S-box-containing protein